MKSRLIIFIITCIFILSGCSESNYYTSREEMIGKDNNTTEDSPTKIKEEVDQPKEEVQETTEVVVKEVKEEPKQTEDKGKESTNVSIEENPVKEEVHEVNNSDEQNKTPVETVVTQQETKEGQPKEEVPVEETVTVVEEVENNTEEVTKEENTEVNKEANEEENTGDGDVVSYYKDQYGDQVDDADEAFGEALLSKVDLDYLMGLLADGLTDEEKAEMKGYLQGQLTPGEYEQMKVLIDKYIYLLNN